ncbi:unnamed protein product [Cyclocybe aegerita]|uniref:Uncharacterized protein n=1 Tax=Cyclocybe aegerita TaxID=1973307 RepID=A0A8S0XGD5_CYCAE|nr:unnamed protein product [Cyclocybe aegerita]
MNQIPGEPFDLALPNPHTPMAFLDPQQTFEATFAVYVAVCTFGVSRTLFVLVIRKGVDVALHMQVFIWETLHVLKADYRLAFKQKFLVSSAVYFVSKIATFAYLLSKSIHLTTELDNCGRVNQIVSGFLTASQSLTALLFFFRVRQVYDKSLLVTVLFLCTWASLTACYALTFGATVSMGIGETRFCRTQQVTHPFAQVGSWASLVNGASVYGAIICRLAGAVPFGTGMVERRAQRFIAAFSQQAQVYYLIALVMNAATLVFHYAIRGPPDSSFRMLLVAPNTVVLNIMACRVYRKTTLHPSERPTAEQWSKMLDSLRLKRPPLTEVDLSTGRSDLARVDVEDQTFHSRDARSFEANKASLGGRSNPVGVEVTKIVEVESMRREPDLDDQSHATTSPGDPSDVEPEVAHRLLSPLLPARLTVGTPQKLPSLTDSLIAPPYPNLTNVHNHDGGMLTIYEKSVPFDYFP